MTMEHYSCHGCERWLAPAEEVIDAVQLHDVTNQQSPRGTREYQEGIHSFFHPGHVQPGWREKGRGPLRQFRPNAS